MPPDPPRTRLVVALQGVKQEAQAREGRRITYSEIADACGVKLGAIRKVAYPGTGYRPSWRLVERLIDFFDVPVERLIRRVPADPVTDAPVVPEKRPGKPARRYGSASRGPGPGYDPERLVQAVRTYLRDEGISQAELARRAGVSAPVVGFVVKARRVGAGSVERLTSAIGESRSPDMPAVIPDRLVLLSSPQAPGTTAREGSESDGRRSENSDRIRRGLAGIAQE